MGRDAMCACIALDALATRMAVALASELGKTMWMRRSMGVG